MDMENEQLPNEHDEDEEFSHLNNEQQMAVMLPDTRHLQILAGPGTGKTMTLVYRVIKMLSDGISPENILVLTLTNRAIRSFKSKLAQTTSPLVSSRVALNTFHSFCQGLLSSHGHLIDLTPGWSIGDIRETRFIMERAAFGTKYAMSLKLRNSLYEEFRSAKIRSALNSSYNPYDFIKDYTKRHVLERYEEFCKKSHVVDYDDLLVLSKKLLEQKNNDGSMLDIKVVLVDEFQDSTRLQWEIIKLLVQKNNCYLTVVGDPNQAIYGFAGSDPELFNQMHESLLNVSTVNLLRNYRSSNQISRASQSLIHLNSEETKNGALQNVSCDFDGEIPTFRSFSDGNSEAKWITHRVQKYLKENPNVQPNEIAILFRTGFSFTPVINSLESAGLDVATYRGAGLFEQEQISLLLTVLKLLHNKSQDIYLLYTLRYPKHILSEVDCDYAMTYATVNQIPLWDTTKFADEWISNPKHEKPLSSFMELLRSMDQTISTDSKNPEAIIQALEEYITKTDLKKLIRKKKGSGKRQLEEIDKLYNMIRITNQEASNNATTVSTALDNFLTGILQYQMAPTENQVVVSTVHAAKGLEWKSVFLAGVSDSNYPHIKTHDSQRDIMEELRVLYVGATRAKDFLSISYYPEFKTVNGNFRQFPKSRFLKPQLISNYFSQGMQKPIPDILQQLDRMKGIYPRVFRTPPKTINFPTAKRALHFMSRIRV